MLKAAKSAGCPAFRNGRIYVEELSEWLASNAVDSEGAESRDSLQIDKLREEVRRLRRENDEKEGKLVSIQEVIEINAKIDAEIIKALTEELGERYLHQMGGVNFAERKVLTQKAMDNVFAKIHARS